MKLFNDIYKFNNKNKVNSFTYVIRGVALVSISLGLFSVIISSFILSGFKEEIKKKIYDFSGHYNISNYSNGLSFKNSPINLSDGLYVKSKNIKDIRSVHPYILNSALIQGKENNIEGVVFNGIDKNYINNISHHIDEIGDNFNLNNSVIISYSLSKKLNAFLYDTVTIFFPNEPPVFRKMLVEGIYNTGLQEIDDLTVFGPISLSRKLYKWDTQKASGLHIFVNKNLYKESQINEIKNNALYNEYVETTNNKYIQIFDWLSLLDKNVAIFFIIIVMVACFNMLSIIFILIIEKTNLIGTLKSFGTNRNIIFNIFFNIGFKITFYGMVIGNSLSFIIIYIQNNFKLFKLNKENYYIDYIPMDFTISNILLINVIMFIMILLSICIPIIYIDRIRVINSIKFS
jgi:lipoprotein-releasing system permease protein